MNAGPVLVLIPPMAYCTAPACAWRHDGLTTSAVAAAKDHAAGEGHRVCVVRTTEEVITP